MKKSEKKELYEAIMTKHLIFGQSRESIAEQFGISTRMVTSVTMIFKYLKEGEYQTIADRIMTQKNYTDGIVYWACEALGIEVPAVIEKAMKDRSEKQLSVKASEKVPAAEAPAPEAPEKKETGNECVYFCRILEELTRTNELLAQLLDASLPHFAADLKDAINANSDQVFGQIKRTTDLVETCARNTRKRGL